MSARGDKTREHLLDVAERLFAQRGIAGVSLREVRLAAGARNTAAMQFHFGDREGLYHALMERHMPRIALIQQQLFDDMLEHNGPDDARALVEVLVRPTNDYLALGPSERAWVQIMGSMASLPDLHLKEMVSAAPNAGVRAGALLYRELTRAMPERLARERLILLAQTSVHLTADHARLLEDPITSRRHLTTEEFVVNLVDMLSAAVFAPATVVAPPRRARGATKPAGRTSKATKAAKGSNGKPATKSRPAARVTRWRVIRARRPRSGHPTAFGDNGGVIPLLALERISSVVPLAYVLAFGGGVISFLSPCVLPLVPGYLSLVTGLDLVTLREGSRRYQSEITVTTGLFVLGFGIVFVLLGLSASAVGSMLAQHQDTLTRISGAVMLAFALFLAGSVFLRAPWLYGELRFHPQMARYGRAAPFVAGAAFAFGWTPCLGPVLGSILTIAANEDRAWAGGTLLAAYTLGLGLPFLVCGLALGRLTGALVWVRRHLPAIVVASAVVVGVFGVLLLFNRLSRANAELSRVLDDVHLSWLVNLG